jgi:hypothetical protein
MKEIKMSRKAILLDVLQEVVADLGQVFTTKDVSEDIRMKQAHLNLLDNIQYHGFVGGALSDHRAQLGIDEIEKHTPRGSRWKKIGIPPKVLTKSHFNKSSQSIPDLPPQESFIKEESFIPEIGPQYTQDNLLTSRMRKHQSWYRAHELHLPYGTGPGPYDTNSYGNMLTRVDGETGRNFLTQEIFEVALDRIAQGRGVVEKYRLLHNMLSSQTMCFNLFGPLVRDHDLAKNLLATIVPEKILEVTRVEIEWAPQPATDYLNDHTAFDAFIEYWTQDGHLVGLGIETKLSEPFSQKVYDRPEYRRWMKQPDSPWNPDSWNKVQAVEYNQLWRDHLLAVALRLHPKSIYDCTRLMLVYHPEDINCARNFLNYKNLLRNDDDSMFSLSLDQIVDRWLSVVKKDDHKKWLKSFKKRYIDLDLGKTSI